MIKMSKESRLFLEKHAPSTLYMDKLGDVLNVIFDLIEDKGFAPPHYHEYNDFGREAQRVYDDIYYWNSMEE